MDSYSSSPCYSRVTCILEVWSLLNGYPGDSLDGKLWLMANLNSEHISSYPCPTPSIVAGNCAYISWTAFIYPCGSEGGQKELCLPDTGDLCFDHWLLLLMSEVQSRRQVGIANAPPPFLSISSPSVCYDLQGTKRDSILPPFIFIASLLGARELRTVHSKATAYIHHICPGKGTGWEKNWKWVKFIS